MCVQSGLLGLLEIVYYFFVGAAFGSPSVCRKSRYFNADRQRRSLRIDYFTSFRVEADIIRSYKLMAKGFTLAN